MTALVYMEDLIYPRLLDTIRERLDAYEIDGILDSRYAGAAGGKALAVSFFRSFSLRNVRTGRRRPFWKGVSYWWWIILLLYWYFRADYNSFFQTSDDWYNRFETASFARILRFFAAILAMSFPAIYVAVTSWHTSLLPTNLILSMAAAREGVPFPSLGEVLLMEISFELIREAGIRLPGAHRKYDRYCGRTHHWSVRGDSQPGQSHCGDCGGFYRPLLFCHTQRRICFCVSAVEIRLYVYGGMAGALRGAAVLSVVLIHLSHLNSFGIPYLMPYVASDLNGYADEKDALLRFPFRMITRRPVFARRNARVKLRKKG